MSTYEIPESGSLGLLAAGHIGLRLWRQKRGTDWMHNLPSEPPRVSPEAAAATIVIVSGMPRSGTSMLMQMVEAAGIPVFTDGERTPDPNNPRGYYEHEKVKSLANDASWILDADGHALKVVAPLLPALPQGVQYKVLYIERDLDEVLRSQSAMLQRDGHAPADDATLRPAYQRFHHAARAWINAHAESLVLQHGDVVREPLAAANAIHAFLGSTNDSASTAAIVDPSLHRQRTTT